MKIDAGAQNILRHIDRTGKGLSTVQSQIASGLKNPDPATDPLSSTIAKSVSESISTTKRAQSVISQAKSTVEIAHSSLRLNADLLGKMKAQAIQASNGTYTSKDLADMNLVFQQNLEQLNSNALSTWGSRTLFDGTFSMHCQTSTNTKEASVTGTDVTSALDDGDLIINGMDIGAVSETAIDIVTAINAQTSITQVIASVSSGNVSLSSVSTINISGNNPEKAGLSIETIPASGVTTVTFADMRTSALFDSSLPNLTTQTNAQAAITAIEDALTIVLNEMTRISLYNTQFEGAEENMAEESITLQDMLSDIQDVDFAEAVTNLSRLSALKEAATAALKTEFDSFRNLGNLVADSLRRN